MTTPQILAVEDNPITLLGALITASFLITLAFLTQLLHLGSNPEFGFIFAGAFVLHLGIHPSRRELLKVLGFAIALIALYVLVGAELSKYWVSRVAGIAGAVGCGSIAVLGLNTYWRNDLASKRVLKTAAILPVFGMIAAIAMGFVRNVPVRTFDLYLYAFEDRLGFQSGFFFGQLFKQYHWLRELASLIYDALGFLPALVLGMAWRTKRRLPFDPMWAFVAAGFFCYFLYQVCPGTAPSAVFGARYPFDPPSVSGLTIGRIAVPDSPRNAIPSMHATWILLAWWAGIGLSRWMKVVSTFFVIVTFMATLGLGEHYLCDLIVAFAFTLAIAAGCMRLPLRDRMGPMIGAGAATLAWLLLLRSGALLSIPGMVAWTMCLVTVAGSVVMQVRLFRKTL